MNSNQPTRRWTTTHPQRPDGGGSGKDEAVIADSQDEAMGAYAAGGFPNCSQVAKKGLKSRVAQN